jgi:hypothetical protein
MELLPKINISNFIMSSVLISVFAYSLGNIVDNIIFPDYIEGDNKNKIIIELVLQLAVTVILKYYINIIIMKIIGKNIKLTERSLQASTLLFPFMMYFQMKNLKKRVVYVSNLMM